MESGWQEGFRKCPRPESVGGKGLCLGRGRGGMRRTEDGHRIKKTVPGP